MMIAFFPLPVRAAASGRVDDGPHSGGYAPTRYLSPRRTPITLRATRTGALRGSVKVDAGGRGAASVMLPVEGSTVPATGEADGATAGSLLM